MKTWIRRLLRKAGIEIYRYSVHTSTGAQINRLLNNFGIDLVLDVGANAGQYATELRSNGYLGRIVSFEPLSSAHARLRRTALNDSAWQVAPRMALGAEGGEAKIHVAGNSLSSSILEMLSRHERAAPDSKIVSNENVPLHRLDAVAGEFILEARSILLKIDTQGYEDRVLSGAAGILAKVVAIQCELSLVPLYADQRLFDQMRAGLGDMGFELFALFPGYVHEETGQTLQLDGFFVRRELIANQE